MMSVCYLIGIYDYFQEYSKSFDVMLVMAELLFLGGSVDEMLDCIVGECRKPIEIE